MPDNPLFDILLILFGGFNDLIRFIIGMGIKKKLK
jgi:hypothetical protein